MYLFLVLQFSQIQIFVQIICRERSLPQVSINCISCRDTNIFAISHSQVIKLIGTCSGTTCSRRDKYLWHVTRNDSIRVVLNNVTTTTGSTRKNLVIRDRVLNDNFSYTFQLTVTSHIEGTVGYAKMELGPVIPPKNGSCTVQLPESRTVTTLIDVVTVECFNWMWNSGEEASPLEYHIYINRTIGAELDWYPIYRGPRANASFYLSPFSGLEDQVLLNVDVIDLLGSQTSAYKA